MTQWGRMAPQGRLAEVPATLDAFGSFPCAGGMATRQWMTAELLLQEAESQRWFNPGWGPGSNWELRKNTCGTPWTQYLLMWRSLRRPCHPPSSHCTPREERERRAIPGLRPRGQPDQPQGPLKKVAKKTSVSSESAAQNNKNPNKKKIVIKKICSPLSAKNLPHVAFDATKRKVRNRL